MPQLVITSCPVRVVIALLAMAASTPGTARPLDIPVSCVHMPESPELVLAPMQPEHD
ncbi:hypothetical protein [Marinobacter segnicrescens]|uniref:hypothetical protein n=1 Tax=Marinobacter segnicrescens TaxID=430453 RepID=UPI003A944D00